MNTTLFPFPHVYEGKRIDGSVQGWPSVCVTCATRACERAIRSEMAICSYGMNYQRVDEQLLVAGFIVREWNDNSAARRKRLREAKVAPVLRGAVIAAISAYQRALGDPAGFS